MIKSICVVGGLGHMGSFHVNRLREQYPTLEVNISDIEDDWSDDDAYIIATPSETHYEIAVKLIKARKNVLIEKPMTFTFNEAMLLYRLSQEYGVVLMDGHTQRFNHMFRDQLLDLYTSQNFIMGYHTTRQDGKLSELTMDLMIHLLELGLYIYGAPVYQIKSVSVEAGRILRVICTIGDKFFDLSVSYGNLENNRFFMSDKVDKVDMLAFDGKTSDPLKFQHEFFINACNRGVPIDHSFFSIYAIQMAEYIQGKINDGTAQFIYDDSVIR